MKIEDPSRTKLGDLFGVASSTTEGRPVIGTHLWPYVIFAAELPLDRVALTEVIRRVPIAGHDVLVTRGGGLFCEPPNTLSAAPEPGGPTLAGGSQPKEKVHFQDLVVGLFNRLICEFALLSLVSEPASFVDVSPGRVIEDHALMWTGSGAREIYTHRTTDWLGHLLLEGRHWVSWRMLPEEILDRARDLRLASRLAVISDSTPALIAAAHSHYSRGRMAEALAVSWIAVEQILGHFWQQHVERVQEPGRRKKLKDYRTYSAAVQAEVLLTAGVLPPTLYSKVEAARAERNDLIHRTGAASQESAEKGMAAMKASIEFLCGEPVAPHFTHRGIKW